MSSSTDPQGHESLYGGDNALLVMDHDTRPGPRPWFRPTTLLKIVLVGLLVAGAAVGAALAIVKANAAVQTTGELSERIDALEKQLAAAKVRASSAAPGPTPSAINATDFKTALADIYQYKGSVRNVEERLDAMALAMQQGDDSFEAASKLDIDDALFQLQSLNRTLSVQTASLREAVSSVASNLQVFSDMVKMHIDADAGEAHNGSARQPLESNSTAEALQSVSLSLDHLAETVARHNVEIPKLDKQVASLQQTVDSVEGAQDALKDHVESELSSQVCKCHAFPNGIAFNGTINGVSLFKDLTSGNGVVQGIDLNRLSGEAIRNTGDQEIAGTLRVSGLGLAGGSNTDTEWHLEVSTSGDVGWQQTDIKGKRQACHSSAVFIVSGADSKHNGCYAASGMAYGKQSYSKITATGALSASPASQVYCWNDKWAIGVAYYESYDFSQKLTRTFNRLSTTFHTDGVYVGHHWGRNGQCDNGYDPNCLDAHDISFSIPATNFEVTIPTRFGYELKSAFRSTQTGAKSNAQPPTSGWPAQLKLQYL